MHRDLQPANVVYDEVSGRVSLTGLGRASRVPREAGKIRAPGRLEGNAVYLAPEATGRLNRQLDGRADLYSLGVVLFELLAGRPPFDDTDPAALVHAHIALDPPDLGELLAESGLAGQPGLSVVVSAIVGKLLAKAAEDRYRSGLGLKHDLERCLAAVKGSGEGSGESRGEIHAFEPGEHDVAERFELPQGLFGREAELSWLEKALAAAAEGHTLVGLVAGYSGVGKTSLVEEMRFVVLLRRWLFASGTFDPGSRATPYGGILAALRGLVVQKLGAPPEQVEAWTRRLVAELGTNLGVLTEALPELLGLVGEPPALPQVPPENARDRFHSCVGRFFATLTEDSHPHDPLVLFLDDLQWVDPASLELLARLLAGSAGPDARGAFLLLGAYRDNEVDKVHPLPRAVAELSARGIDVDTLRLHPLSEQALSRLIAEALYQQPSDVAPLAELVYRKTAGNPFFARTFLSILYQRRLLCFTATATPPRWTWDLKSIAGLEAMESVIELVAGRLSELPASSRQILATASVLGKEFDVLTLGAVGSPDGDPDAGDLDAGGDGASAVEGILIEACHQGLLVKVGASPWEETQRYAFVHDRVREGAHELLGEEERAHLHLRIGRLLRDQAGPRQAGPGYDIFEITDHLNRAPHRSRCPRPSRDRDPA